MIVFEKNVNLAQCDIVNLTAFKQEACKIVKQYSVHQLVQAPVGEC